MCHIDEFRQTIHHGRRIPARIPLNLFDSVDGRLITTHHQPKEVLKVDETRHTSGCEKTNKEFSECIVMCEIRCWGANDTDNGADLLLSAHSTHILFWRSTQSKYIRDKVNKVVFHHLSLGLILVL